MTWVTKDGVPVQEKDHRGSSYLTKNLNFRQTYKLLSCAVVPFGKEPLKIKPITISDGPLTLMIFCRKRLAMLYIYIS